MLVNPTKLMKQVAAGTLTQYGQGLFDSPIPHNGDWALWGRNDFERSYPDCGDWPLVRIGVEGLLDSVGVVDHPEQFAKLFGLHLHALTQPLTVLFTHVAKDSANAGQGGGWRWHKWGVYWGTGTPQAEYLDDEAAFVDGVYCFHIYRVDNLDWELPHE